jgi:hypothetical protein
MTRPDVFDKVVATVVYLLKHQSYVDFILGCRRNYHFSIPSPVRFAFKVSGVEDTSVRETV